MPTSNESSLNPVFVDLSAVIEYCCVYFNEHHYASEVLDKYYEEGGNIIVSEEIWIPFNKRMSNRERLWDLLLSEASEHMGDPGLGASEFKADILNYTSLEQKLGFTLKQNYLPDIKNLRKEFEDGGFNSFRNLLDDARIQGKVQRREIEQTMDIDEYHRGDSRGSWMAKSQISQYTSSNVQTESLMDFGYWRRENEGNVLIGSMCEAADHIDELSDAICSISNVDVDILTPKNVFEKTAAFR